MKKIIAYILLAIIAVVITACGSNDYDETAPPILATPTPMPPPPQITGTLGQPAPTPIPTPTPTGTSIRGFFPDDREMVEVELWHVLSVAQRANLMEMIYAFHDEQPYVRVFELYHGNHENLRHNTIVADYAGILPHLSQATLPDMASYRSARMLLPLNPFMDDPHVGMATDCISALVLRDICAIDDTWYALPFTMGMRVLYVNEDILQAQGFNAPATWEDAIRIARAVTTTSFAADIESEEEEDIIVSTQYGMGFNDGFDWEWIALLRQHGGAFMNDGARRATFATDEGVDALVKVIDLIENQHARVATTACFAQGEVAMFFASSTDAADIAQLVNGNFNMSVIPVPQFNEQNHAELTGDVLMLFENVSHSTNERVGAWEFMRHILQPETNARWVMQTGFLPMTNHVFEDETFSAFFPREPFALQATLTALPHAFIRTLHPNAFDIRNVVLEELAFILHTEETIEEMLYHMQLRVNDALSQ